MLENVASSECNERSGGRVTEALIHGLQSSASDVELRESLKDEEYGMMSTRGIESEAWKFANQRASGVDAMLVHATGLEDEGYRELSTTAVRGPIIRKEGKEEMSFT